MPIRITGLNSGLDTEAIISALVSSYNYKTQKYKKAQTKLSWKQDAWKELNTKIYSLYTSVGNLRFSSAYNMKSCTVSDSTKISVSAGSSAVNGSYSVQVTSLAKAGYLTGARLNSGTTASTTLGELGYTDTNGKLSVTVGGKTTDITVSKDMKIQEVVNQLKEAGVNASYDEANRRFFVSAKDTGIENDFSLSGANASGTAALTALGLNVASNATTEEYKALAAYSSLTIDEMKQIVADKVDATNENTSLKTDNNIYQKLIAYAKASDELNTVAAKGSEADYSLLEKLVGESSLENKYVDANGNVFTYDDTTKTYTRVVEEFTDGTYDETRNEYTTADGVIYKGGVYENGKYTVKETLTDDTGLTAATEKYDRLAADFGLVTETTNDEGETVKDTSELDAFKKNLSTVKSTLASVEVSDEHAKELFAEAKAAVEAGTVSDYVTATEATVAANNEKIAENNELLAANEKLTVGMTDEQIVAFKEKADYAQSVVDGTATASENFGATRIDASDATIYVNGAEYTGNSNIFNINGMTITAAGVTGTTYDPTETNAVSATVNTDVQGIYDKVKDFLTQYNALINEMTSLYNADSAKGYEPLTDEEKDAMSDTEVEKWEEKIKASLLRRDDTLSSLMSSMTNAMSKGVEINGKTYYLSTFGIKTLGYLNAPKNEQNAYHIDGDADDINTSGNADKLMAAIAEDPDTVMEFMQGLTENLYEAVDKKMKSTTLSSTYTVYNDKEMASEYSDYTSLITKWQERLEQQEEYYYNKFSQMETALSKLNSQTSAMSGFFG